MKPDISTLLKRDILILQRQLQHFELTLHKGKSSVRAVFWVIAQLPWIVPHSAEVLRGLTREKIWIISASLQMGGLTLWIGP